MGSCNYNKDKDLTDRRKAIRNGLLNIIPKPYKLYIEGFNPCSENTRLTAEIEYDPNEDIDGIKSQKFMKSQVIEVLERVLDGEDFSVRVVEEYKPT